MSSSPFCRR
jgi:hypothetical protein